MTAAPHGRTPLGAYLKMSAGCDPQEWADIDDSPSRCLLSVLRDIERAGVTTLQGIADALNARGIRTAGGRRWYASTARNLLVRGADQVEGVKDAA